MICPDSQNLGIHVKTMFGHIHGLYWGSPSNVFIYTKPGHSNQKLVVGNCECVFKASRTLVTSRHLLRILPQVRSSSLSQGVKWLTPQAGIFWWSTQGFLTAYSSEEFEKIEVPLYYHISQSCSQKGII